MAVIVKDENEIALMRDAGRIVGEGLKLLQKAAGDATFVPADDLLLKLRWHKTPDEIKILREAYRITEEAVKKTVEMIRPGVREWEIEAAWRVARRAHDDLERSDGGGVRGVPPAAPQREGAGEPDRPRLCDVPDHAG